MPKLFLSPSLKSGSVLIVSIWILVFFTILSVGLYRIVSTQIKLVKTLEERTLALYPAKAACAYAALERKFDHTASDSFSELRHKRKKDLGGGGKFSYTYLDEESKLNINSASLDMLSRLPGLNLELAQSIVGSELKPFNLKEELLLVEGITEEIFNQFKDYITVYTEGKINLNTACEQALKALGLSDDFVMALNEFRLGKDGKEFSEDDGVFENTGEIVNKLKDAGLSGLDEVTLISLINQGLIGVESKNLILQVETEILYRAAMKYAIVMDKEGKIKQWSEF